MIPIMFLPNKQKTNHANYAPFDKVRYYESETQNCRIIKKDCFIALDQKNKFIPIWSDNAWDYPQDGCWS